MKKVAKSYEIVVAIASNLLIYFLSRSVSDGYQFYLSFNSSRHSEDNLQKLL